jgi:hypothetical protein
VREVIWTVDAQLKTKLIDLYGPRLELHGEDAVIVVQL